MRLSTGVEGIDELLHGGLPAGRLYVISGPPGSGKTTLGCQFVVQGARDRERSLYLGMHESQEELIEDMANFEFPFEAAVRSGAVLFFDATDESGDFKRSIMLHNKNHSGPMNLATQIRGLVRSKDIQRIVIDSAMILDHLFADEDASLTQFLVVLKKIDATILLTSEMTDPTVYSDPHYIAHGVLFLHNYLSSEGMQRGLQILKMRGTDIETDVFKTDIDSTGIVVDTGAVVAA